MRTGVKLGTFQIGAPAKPGEGLRIGTTRRPPRGVAKSDWRRRGYFDVWLPVIAPSEALLRRYQKRIDDPRARAALFKAYERELARPPQRYIVELLAEMASRTPIAIGCFCEDESRCHRSVLRRVIEAG